PASNTIGFDPAVRTSTLAFPHRRAKEWRGSGTVEQALDPAILGCQLFEKSCRIGRAITVAIWAGGGSARSNLAGKHRQRRLVIDIVPFGQCRDGDADLGGARKRLPEDPFGAPFDILEQPPVKLLQPDQVIAAIGS